MDFASLLHPMPTESFISDHLGRGVCVLEGPFDRFESILPWAQINDILERHWFDATRIRIVKGHRHLNISEFSPSIATYPISESGLRRRQLSAESLSRHLRDGATLHIKSVEDLSEEVAELASSIERVFKERASIELLVSYGETPGYQAHIDYVDVFAIQIYGRKKWAVWEPTRKWPLLTDPESAPKPEGEPQEIVLTSGNVLYVPRGTWHLVTPAQDLSVHLSVSVSRRTGIDLMKWLVEGLHTMEICRQDLPMPVDGESADQEQHLRQLRETVIKFLDHPNLIDRFLATHQAAQPFRQVFDLPRTITGSGLGNGGGWNVRWCAPMAVVDMDPDGLVVRAGGRCHRFGAESLPVIRFLMARTTSSLDTVGEEAINPALQPSDVRRIVWDLSLAGLAVVEEIS